MSLSQKTALNLLAICEQETQMESIDGVGYSIRCDFTSCGLVGGEVASS